MTMLRALIATTAAATAASAALASIERKGAYMFNSQTGDRFYVKGVDYAANYGTGETKPTGQIAALDVLANNAGCDRDVPLLKELGVNTIRVYQIDSASDHSHCMSLLDAAGIYVLADLATPIDAISGQSPSWNIDLFQHYVETVVEMGKYSNTLGFNIGNEVLNGPADNQAAPYLKAAVRDVKAYMNTHNYTQLIGYAATDRPDSRVELPHYFACAQDGVDETTIADYWGINLYEWCSPTTFETSGYKDRTAELADLGIVAMLTENGCGSMGKRPFDDTGVILGPQMSNVWSGTFAFEFINESNNFGIVALTPDGKSIVKSSDFDNYKNAIAAATPANIKIDAYTPTISLPLAKCPANDAEWQIASTLPPTPNAALCECAVAASGCIASSTVTDLGATFGLVCGTSPDACSLIAGNGSASGGHFGTYSMCSPQQQLSIVLGAYYESQNGAADACSFGGAAQLQTSTTGFKAGAAQCESQHGFQNGVGVPTPSAAIEGANPASSTGGPKGNTGNNGTTKGGNNGDDSAIASAAPLVSILAAVAFGSLSLFL